MSETQVTVLVIAPVGDDAIQEIAALDPRVKVVDARGFFDIEIKETWPSWTVQRYLPREAKQTTTREQRDQLLADADVVLGGWPPLIDLRLRAPKLRWFHQLPAGASNLLRTDLWKSDVTVTTSRGFGNTKAMGEFVLASFYHFARGLHRAYADQREHRFAAGQYRPIMLEGKTVCVLGAGGIGVEVGRLCASVGMRVLGTKRTINRADPLPAGFERLETPDHLHEMLAQSEFVAVCCQWTPATTKLIGRDSLAAMKPGSVLVNVARGEIIDEEALVEALGAGKLRGVALDVYVGEFEHEPDRRLWDDPRVLITPHVSANNDISQHRGIALFCKNLRAYLDGRPLTNVIDWSQGY